MSLISDVYAYFKRYLICWTRDKRAVLTFIMLPAAWLVFMGLAFPTKFTDNYLLFLTPGIMGMTILFNSMNGGALLNYDKEFGMMNKFLTLPASRESILFGNITFNTFRGVLQSICILALAVLLGVHLPGIPEIIYILVILSVFGALFSAAAGTIALLVDEHGAYSAINGLFSLPFSSRARR